MGQHSRGREPRERGRLLNELGLRNEAHEEVDNQGVGALGERKELVAFLPELEDLSCGLLQLLRLLLLLLLSRSSRGRRARFQ